MEHIFEKLVRDFEQGKMSRRQLIQGLALTATAACGVNAAPPARAAQTGLRAVSIEHISLDVRDHQKVQDWYVDMFGLQRIGDAKGKNKNHVLIGDTFLTMGVDDSIPWRDTSRRNTPRIDHFAIGVEPWDDKNDDSIKGAGPRIEAELRRRGFKIEQSTGSVRLIDPEGMVVQLQPKGYLARKVGGFHETPAAMDAQTGLRAVSIEHITLDVRNPQKVQDWYADLFGLQRIKDAQGRTKNHVLIGDTYLTIGIDDPWHESQAMRNPTKSSQPRIDHFAIGVEPWDNKQDSSIKGAGPRIEAELRRRGYKINPTGPVNVTDPEGMAVQLQAKGYLARKLEGFQ